MKRVAHIPDSHWIPAMTTVLAIGAKFEMYGESLRDLLQRFVRGFRKNQLKLVDADLVLLHLAHHRSLMAKRA